MSVVGKKFGHIGERNLHYGESTVRTYMPRNIGDTAISPLVQAHDAVVDTISDTATYDNPIASEPAVQPRTNEVDLNGEDAVEAVVNWRDLAPETD